MYVIHHLGIVYGPYGGIGKIIQQREAQGAVTTTPRSSRWRRITRFLAALF